MYCVRAIAMIENDEAPCLDDIHLLQWTSVATEYVWGRQILTDNGFT